MKVQLILVSIDFGDYLTTTLPWNASYFDRILVVTSPNDEETKDVCRANCVEYVETTRHLDEGGFNKGKAINNGFRRLDISPDKFICLTDADIIFPKQFVDKLPMYLNPDNTIRGCHRWMCESSQDWLTYLQDGDMSRFIPSTRNMFLNIPVGYFQLWSCQHHREYPEDKSSAGSSDLAFSRKFRGRAFIDDFVIHLNEVGQHKAADYKGRQTPRWSLA